MSVSCKLSIGLGLVCAILMGTNIYAIGRYRAAAATGTELKRQLVETKRQLKELSRQYDERLTSLENNNRRAKSIVESMGTELQRNDSSIQGTIGLIRQLRSQIKDLQDLYTGQPDGRDSCRGSNSMEDM